VAVNYAFSIDAGVAFVTPIARSELHPLQKLVYEWKNQGSDYAYQQLRRKIVERVEGINFLDYQFATFFTLGLPYGLALNNMIPFTHVFLHPGCDLFVVNSIGCELFASPAGSVLLFSPRRFGREETDDVVRMLEQARYWVKAVLGEQASVNALADYGEHFPFDLMHICSHGGETSGYYVIQEFADRTGTKHRIEYEEIVGFSPADRDRVLVARKAIFRKFDGFVWMSEELKAQQIPRYVFEDMRKALPLLESDSSTTQRERVKAPIYASCHIECSDSIHQGDFHSLACNTYPVVFNNTCSSWYEIAINFIAAGARAYIGTIWKVDNDVAREAAKVFYEHVLANANMLDAFYEMTRAIRPAKYRNIYLFWGLHFSSLRCPEQKADQRVFKILVASLASWRKEYYSTADPQIRRLCLRVLRFISHELLTSFTPEHLARFRAEVEAHLPADANSPSDEAESEDSLGSRGVIDF
jgi:hypothetical protein